ncbi:MAG: SPASM domain-containing protein [Chitinophagales bacterium]
MQFDSPLRVTWTAGPASPFARVAAALAEAGVMEVALSAPLGVVRGQAAEVAGLARTSRVELVVDAGELADGRGWPALEDVLTSGIPAALTFDFTSVPKGPAAGLLARLSHLKQAGPPVPLAIAARPDAANLERVLRLASLAAQAGVAEVKLLHPELAGRPAGRTYSPLSPAALARAQALFPAGWPFPSCRLLVHDLFLGRVLLGDGPSSAYGGCQAGGAMAHVDEEGRVYPCSAFPVVVGDLNEHDLQSIWDAEALENVRRRLAEPPGVCAGCTSSGVCRGGCRGLSWALSGSWDGRDPACSGPEWPQGRVNATSATSPGSTARETSETPPEESR